MYIARRGSGVMKHVQRCSASFSRYSGGKIEAKLYLSSNNEEDTIVVAYPPKAVLVEVALVLDLSVSTTEIVEGEVGVKESPKNIAFGEGGDA